MWHERPVLIGSILQSSSGKQTLAMQMTLRSRVWTALVGICLFTSASFAEVGANRAHVSKLLSEGRYDQAELVCRQSLTAADLNETERSIYVCDLIHVLTERARRADDANVDREWSEVRSAGEGYLEEKPASPRSVLVRLQLATAQIAEAEQMLGRVRIRPAQIRQQLQQAARQLQQLGTETDSRLRSQRSSDPNEDGYLNEKALRAVRASIRQRRAQALLLLAETDEVRPADRTYACAQARSELEKISPGDLSDRAWWQTRVALVKCQRLRQDWPAAEKLIEELNSAPSARSVESWVAAEQLRVALDRKKWNAVRESISAAPSAASPELALARFDALLRLSEEAALAGDQSLSKSLQSKAAETLPQMEANFGTWWRRRAEKRLLQFSAIHDLKGKNREKDSPSELTAAIGRSLLAEGKPVEAAAQLMRAARQAEADDRSRAEQLAREASAIVWEAQRWNEARRWYLELASLTADQQEAAEAHLMAVRSAAQAARDTPDQLAAYAALLAGHTSRWPASPTADTARTWQAKLAEQQQDWPRAASLHVKELLRHESRPAAQSVVNCFRRAIKNGSTKPEDVLAAAARLVAAEHTNSLLTGLRLQLEYSPRVAGASKSKLAAAASTLATSTPEFEQACLMLCELAVGNRDNSEARRHLANLESNEEVDLALETLDRMSGWDSQAVAQLRLELVEHYFVDQQTESAIDWQRQRAAALRDLGQVASSIDAARKCVAASPQTAADQWLLASCLLATDSKSELREAEAIGERLIGGLKKGTPAWFRAKLLLAETWMKLGEMDRASRLLQMTNVLYPEWGGAEAKAAFEALRKRVPSEAGR